MSFTPSRNKHGDNATSDSNPWPLIGATDPPPFTVINEQGDAPFLLVCDHASRAFPAAMNQLGVADWVLEKHVASDLGADQITRRLAEQFNAPAVLAGYSRLVMDLNRQLHDPSAFIGVSDGIAIPGNLDITEQEKALRIKSFFEPYHDEISNQLERFTVAGKVPALVSIHTCTPVFSQVVRKWHIGVMWDTDPRIAVPLLENLNAMPDICAGDNEPYSGRHLSDYTVDHHAERVGFPCVGIEVRQDLVSTEEGLDRWVGLLADALRPILAQPGLYQVNSSPAAGQGSALNPVTG